MAAAAAPGMERVRQEFQGEDVEFLFVYAREAHPGENYPAHATLEEKKRNATVLMKQEHIHAVVIIDDLEGTIHRAFGLKPNMIYLIDKEGRIAFRALWTEEATLRRSLRNLLDREGKGDETTLEEDRRMLRPMLRGLGDIPRVLRRAGPQAVKDFQRVLGPGVWLAACTFSRFRLIFRYPGRFRAILFRSVALAGLTQSLSSWG
ncbi:MAG: hypothetical protein ACE5HC_10785 [Candidatus Binatia bacterium]